MKLNLICLLLAAVTIVVTSFNGGILANSSNIKFVLYGKYPPHSCATSIKVSYTCFINIVASGCNVFFSSCTIMKTAVFCLPISFISKSLYDSIWDKFSRDENNFTFCLNVAITPCLVSSAVNTTPEALIYAGFDGSLELKYSFI